MVIPVRIYIVLAGFFLFPGLAGAEGLPARIDFRKDPAWLILGVSSRLSAHVTDQVASKCPQRKHLDAVTTDWLARSSELQKIEAEIQAKMDKAPAGEAYRARFLEKANQNPAYVELTKKIAGLNSERASLQTALNPCEEAIRNATFEEVDLYADRSLTAVKAKLRFFLKEDSTEIRILPSERWQPFHGDFAPGGESTYFYLTVLEKDGDRFAVPILTFKAPLWFDYAKSFGEPAKIGGERGIDFVFPRKGAKASNYYAPTDGDSERWAPEVIESGSAVFRVAPTAQSESEMPMGDEEVARRVSETLKVGKPKRMKLDELFDSNGKLRIRPVIGC